MYKYGIKFSSNSNRRKYLHPSCAAPTWLRVHRLREDLLHCSWQITSYGVIRGGDGISDSEYEISLRRYFL